MSLTEGVPPITSPAGGEISVVKQLLRCKQW